VLRRTECAPGRSRAAWKNAPPLCPSRYFEGGVARWCERPPSSRGVAAHATLARQPVDDSGNLNKSINGQLGFTSSRDHTHERPSAKSAFVDHVPFAPISRAAWQAAGEVAITRRERVQQSRVAAQRPSVREQT
jgi:hypothetical protein